MAMMGDFNAHTADQDEGYGDVDEDIFSFIQEGGQCQRNVFKR